MGKVVRNCVLLGFLVAGIQAGNIEAQESFCHWWPYSSGDTICTSDVGQHACSQLQSNCQNFCGGTFQPGDCTYDPGYELTFFHCVCGA